ncbi:flagellar export chaperone FliS [Ammoniphilus resinae]|uniref:Flagellar protein FliS n=1 Tax=Ammoniphilus resinae TaxID=861532 RepID=A0ABS4GMJ0_9BACL|nr:flagellar export chaperone FliS [Ammoniphilus resinae]MBP1931483.1 flagellar protein FliS [Ammoniphilus resinae]
MEEKLSQLTEEIVYKKTPQEITNLLYQACKEKIEKAIVLMKKKDYIEANRLLQKGNDLLYRLGAGINYEAGIVADQLEALYDYMANALIEANIKKDISKLEEVLQILHIVQEAWSQAMMKGVDNTNRLMRKKVLAYDQDFHDNYGAIDRKE